MRTLLAVGALAGMMLAGCASESGDALADPIVAPALDGGFLAIGALLQVNYTEQVVDAAIGYASDLYEPTMEVSDSGAIYVTGHTIGVDTTGAPVFGSYDHGEKWTQLPFTSTATMPAGMHGATPPVSDEIFLVAGDDGFLYGVDITAFAFPVNAWADDGAEHVYYNPNAYDRVGAAMDAQCSLTSLNDRPWAAYGDGKLLMVNNPGGGPMEIGVMDVPVQSPLAVPGNPVTGPVWNTCASSGGYIPGIPDMRDDHFFAVPQTDNGKLHIVTGYATDLFDVTQRHVLNVTNTGGGTSNYGQVVFDEGGTMFIGIRNNTEEDAAGDRTGQLLLAVSTDDGESFVERVFLPGAPTTSLYMDGNMNGPGALLTWGQDGEAGTDWFAAHLLLGDDGAPMVTNPMRIVKDGPPPSAHVQGAALGPDGRAHIVTFHGGYGPADGATPLHVWVQQDGPGLSAGGIVDLPTLSG